METSFSTWVIWGKCKFPLERVWLVLWVTHHSWSVEFRTWLIVPPRLLTIMEGWYFSSFRFSRSILWWGFICKWHAKCFWEKLIRMWEGRTRRKSTRSGIPGKLYPRSRQSDPARRASRCKQSLRVISTGFHSPAPTITGYRLVLEREDCKSPGTLLFLGM